MLPAIVLLEAEADLHERTPLGPFRLADEMKTGLLRRAVGLARVALDAGADDVFPSRRAAAIARDDVVQIQILAVEHAPAVLAGVLVALKNVVARELDLLFRQPVVGEQQDDARDADAEGNGVDGFLVRRVPGQVAPFLEAEGAERTVVRIDHHLRLALEKERQSATGGADVDRLPQPIQHKHMLV